MHRLHAVTLGRHNWCGIKEALPEHLQQQMGRAAGTSQNQQMKLSLRAHLAGRIVLAETYHCRCAWYAMQC